MATKTWIANAQAAFQVQTYAPGPQPAGTTITATINGKTASYTSASGTNDDLVAGLYAAILAVTSTAPEFGEVTPTTPSYSPTVPAPNATYLQLKATTAGVPFTLTISLTTPPTVSVVRTAAGAPAVNETQQLTIGPNGQSGSFTFTWGGNTTGAIPLPPQPLAAATGAAGSVDAGTHQYVVTFITANGETEASPAVSITLASALQVSLTAIPTGPATVTARNIYRTKIGGSTFYLLHQINDNATTTYTDNTADASLGANSPPPTNFAFEGAVQALASVGANNFKVGGAAVVAVPNTDPTKQVAPAAIVYTYSFVGSLGGASQALATANVTSVTVLPTITVAETQAGYPIQSAIQQIGWKQIIGTAAPSGNFTISLPALGVTTGKIPNNATAATVLAAIQAAVPPACDNSFAVSLASSTNAGYSWNITYQGLLANQSVPQATIDLSGMTPAASDTLTAVQKQTQVGSSTGQDETVKVTINNSPTGGNWYLDVVDPNNGNAVLATSTAIGNNPTAAQVQTALGGAAFAQVAGSTGGPFTISLVGELGSRKLTVLWASSLTGAGAAAGSPPTSNTTGLAAPSNLSGGHTGIGALSGTYYYEVTATNTTGETTVSNELSLTMGGINAGSAYFSWNNVAGASGYKIYRGTSAGGENKLIATISAANPAYDDYGAISVSQSPPISNTAGISAPSGTSATALNQLGGTLTAGTTYYYVVTATNASGETVASSEASATPDASHRSIAVAWGTVTGATGYNVYRGTAAGAENLLIASMPAANIPSNSSGTFYDLGQSPSAATPPSSNTTALTAPTQNATTPSGSGGSLASATYYYKITATNSSGETTGSNEQSAIVTGPTGSVALSWNAVTGATGYRAYRGTAAGAENLLVATVPGGSTTSYTDTGAVSGTTSIVETAAGAAAINEVQSIILSGATGGTFELAFAGNATTPISYNSTAANLQTILQALLGANNVTISGSAGGPYIAIYSGTLAGSPQPLLTPIATGLTGSVVTAQTLTTVTTSTGPNNWDNAANWSPSGVPVNGDTVIFQNTTVPCLYGLAQSAVTLAALQIDMSFVGGKIGLPAWNGKYYEYRQQYLQIGVTGTILIGNGKGSGPTLIKLDTGTNATKFLVNNCGNSTDPALPAILWKGNRSSGTTEIDIYKGKMGVAMFAGETATVDTIRQGFVSNKGADTYVFVGGGTTLTNWYKDGGDGELHANATTVRHEEGTLSIFDGLSATVVTTLNLIGGTVADRSTGAIATLTVGTGSVYDRTDDSRTKTVTTTTIYGKSTFLDPHGSITFTNPITLSNCGVPDLIKLDLGTNITLQRVQL